MRITIAAVIAASLLALTGCSSQPKPEAKPKATPTVSKSDRFLDAVHNANLSSWDEKSPADSELQALPQQWCDGLEQGHSVEYLFSNEGGLYPIGEDWGTMKADANELLLMGVKVYCPKLRGQVTDELRSNGEY